MVAGRDGRKLSAVDSNQLRPGHCLNRFPEHILDSARRVVRMEAAAVAALEGRLGEPFVGAVQAILDASGRVIVSGVGKSGIIARKIAATLTSTGSPAIFLHPIDA